MEKIKAFKVLLKNQHLSSLEIHLHLQFCKTQNTYLYIRIMQFPVRINTTGSKTPTTFIPFHTKYDLQVHSFD